MSAKHGSVVSISECIAHVEDMLKILPGCGSSRMSLMFVGTMLAIAAAYVFILVKRLKLKDEIASTGTAALSSERTRVEELTAALKDSEGRREQASFSDHARRGESPNALVATLRTQLRASEKTTEEQSLILKNTYVELDTEKGERLFEGSAASVASARAAEASASAIAQLESALKASEGERVGWKQSVPPLEAEVEALAEKMSACEAKLRSEEAAKDLWRGKAQEEAHAAAGLRRELEASQHALLAAKRDAGVVDKANVALLKKLHARHARAVAECRLEAESALGIAAASSEAGKAAALKAAQRRFEQASQVHSAVVGELAEDVGRLHAAAMCVGHYEQQHAGLLLGDDEDPSRRMSATTPVKSGGAISPTTTPLRLTLTPSATSSPSTTSSSSSSTTLTSLTATTTHHGVHLPYQRAMVELTQTKQALGQAREEVGRLKSLEASTRAQLDQGLLKAGQVEGKLRKEVLGLRVELQVCRARALEVPEGMNGHAEALMAKTDLASARHLLSEANALEAKAREAAASSLAAELCATGAASASALQAAQATKAQGQAQDLLEGKAQQVLVLQEEVDTLKRQLSNELAGGFGQARDLRMTCGRLQAELQEAQEAKESLIQEGECKRRELFRCAEALSQAELKVRALEAKASSGGLLVERLAQQALSPPKPPPYPPGASAGGAAPFLLDHPSSSSSPSLLTSPPSLALVASHPAAFAASEVRRLERSLVGKDMELQVVKEQHARDLAAAVAAKGEVAAVFAEQRREMERQLRELTANRTTTARDNSESAAAGVSPVFSLSAAAAAAAAAVALEGGNGDGSAEESARVERRLEHAEQQVVQEKRLYAALSLECEDRASKVASLESQGLVMHHDLRECKQELAQVEDELAVSQDELAVLRSVRSLRSSAVRQQVSELASIQPSVTALGARWRSSSQQGCVEASAHVAWAFLRVFEKEAGISPKFVGPAEVAEGAFLSTGGASGRVSVPMASWSVCRAVFAPGHNLAAALERITPQVVAHPRHAAALEGLSKLVDKSRFTVEAIHAASPACAVVWTWAVATLACADNATKQQLQQQEYGN